MRDSWLFIELLEGGFVFTIYTSDEAFSWWGALGGW